MENVVERWRSVIRSIALAEADVDRPTGSVTLVAVSKTYGPEMIAPVIEAGHHVFGENRVQEAQSKWPALREQSTAPLDVHLIGPLQSNKAKEAVATFDRIQSVDREKIAGALANEMARQNRRLPCTVQVNTGEEPQKAGVSPSQTPAFVAKCREQFGLVVDGLMCIPPVDEEASDHFSLLVRLADETGLPIRSMGMSGDYRSAIRQGATHVRVGSAIFGARS